MNKDIANNIKFSEKAMELVDRIIARYPDSRKKSALIPVLHIAQAEFSGWLSADVMDYVANILGILPIEVYEVASFYSMFNLEPVGNCVIEVCHTGPCWLNGAEEIISYLEKKLNIKAGETTKDGKFTIKRVECLADCDHAPVIHVGFDFYRNMDTAKVDNLIDKYNNSNQSSHINPYTKVNTSNNSEN
jgi:NADH-quinone oxidoreductase subunit E